jgi:hypothetical protein
VPYLDKDHWSLYILEEEQTIHYDYILGFHSNTTYKEFAHNVHTTWALSRGLYEDDTKFATFLNVYIVISKVFAQKNSQEYGHQVVFNFKTYIQERGMLASLLTYHVSRRAPCHFPQSKNYMLQYK